MLIPIKLKIPVYVHKDKLPELYEMLKAIQKVSEDHNPDSMLNEYLQSVEEKMNYLKYREAEIEDRLREERETQEIKDAERERLSKPRQD